MGSSGFLQVSVAINLILFVIIFNTHMKNELYSVSSADTMKASGISGGCRISSRIDQVREFQGAVFRAPKPTDKVFVHGYHYFYGPNLAPYKNKPNLKLLEIGAAEGRSTSAWLEYFEDANADILTNGGEGDNISFQEEGCILEISECSKVRVFHGDQSDTDMLEEMIKQQPDGWDIIIDDASHVPAHQIITFEALWKNVNPGGLYVVEDIFPSYWSQGELYGYKFDAGILSGPPRNAVSRFQKYADVINRGYWGERNHGYSYFEGDHEIEEITFSQGIVYVKKALSSEDVDTTGKHYHYYPVKPTGAIYHAENIAKSLDEAKRVFMKESEGLLPWYTAPSRLNAA